MQHNIIDKPDVFFKRGQVISDSFLKNLNHVNQQYSKTKNFSNYTFAISQLFKIKPVTKITVETKYYLAGFLEGEGCLSIGIKKNNVSRFKLYLDPEFHTTQHINGISNLYLIMLVFQTGRIRYKTGSNATFVYTIDNRINLQEKVIPFYEQYVNVYGCQSKKYRFHLFKKLLCMFAQKAHLDLNKMVYEVLPLWDQLRVQRNQSNETFHTLKDAQAYVKQTQNQ